MKRRVSVFITALLLILNLGMVFDFGTVKVEAATPTVVSRITEIGAAYPEGSFFTVNGKSCTHDPGAACSNCKLANILAARHPEFSGLNGERWTCNAFAYWAFYYIHGHTYDQNTTISYSLANAKQGDFVAFGGNKHYGIYMRDNCVLDANGRSASTVGEITHVNPIPANNYPNSVVVYHSDAVRGGAGINQAPKGSVDSILGGEGKIYVAGWAFDPDVPSTSMDVHVYIGGSTNGEGHVISTNRTRTDVNDAYGITGAHGFGEWIETNRRGSYVVEVYALDNKGTLNTLIKSQTVTITDPPAPHTHSYSSSLTKSATCAETGIRTYRCACGDSYTEVIPKSSTHGKTEIRNARAAQVGVAGYTGDTYCTVCNTLLESGEVIAALQPDHVHSYSPSITAAPSCIKKGIRTYTCICGDSYTEEIAMTAHQTVTKFEKAATCSSEGYTGDVYCNVCGTLIKEGSVIAKLAHTWDAGKVTQEATGTAAGVKTYTCTVCGATKTASIPRITSLASGLTITDKVTNGVYKVNTDGITVRFIKPVAAKTSAVIPDTITYKGLVCKVTSIAEKAFYQNTVLKTLAIGANVKAVYANAFNGCTALTKVTGGTRLVKLYTGSFANCKRMTTFCTLPATLTSIGAKAFCNDAVLTKIVGGAGVTEIGDYAFYGCKKLAAMPLGSKLTSIGAKAFTYCYALPKIVIPAKVKKIGQQAFYKCTLLKSITIKSTLLTSSNVGSGAFTGIYARATCLVPSAKLKSYKTLLKARGMGSGVVFKAF